jgi:hypothetical protein
MRYPYYCVALTFFGVNFADRQEMFHQTQAIYGKIIYVINPQPGEFYASNAFQDTKGKKAISICISHDRSGCVAWVGIGASASGAGSEF